MYSGSESVEMTLMNKRQCNVFQIPPITSAAGHRAEDWRGKQMWRGYCKISMIDAAECVISFVNEDSTLFAKGKFSQDNYDHVVQRCVDSSRFFAVLIKNPQSGQTANIGVQFPERNDSFDFIGGLDQFVKHYRIERGLEKQEVNVSKQNMSNFAVEKGEKFTLSINMGNGKTAGGYADGAQKKKGFGGGLKALKKPQAVSNSSGSGSAPMGFGLGPAPSQPKQEQYQQQQDLVTGGEVDLLGSISNQPKDDGPQDFLSSLGINTKSDSAGSAGNTFQEPVADLYSQLQQVIPQADQYGSSGYQPQSSGSAPVQNSPFVPMPMNMGMGAQQQPMQQQQQQTGFVPQPMMQPAYVQPLAIQQQEQPQKKADPFGFVVLGKGKDKPVEAVDNSKASMGFDDLFGGKPQPQTGSNPNGFQF